MNRNILKIKTGDAVKVLSGKDSGKTGKVSQVLPGIQKVVVDGVNKMIKHLRSPKKGEKGQRLEFFGPIHISNVALICPKCNKPTRVGRVVTTGETGQQQKNRKCKKCGETYE